MARTQPRQIPSDTHTDWYPMFIPVAWERLGVLRERGFVQLSKCPLPPRDYPFVVKVCVPPVVADVPFYLYITNEDSSFEFVIADDAIVEELMSEMGRNSPAPETRVPSWMYCWAEVMEEGEINFDTKTSTSGFRW